MMETERKRVEEAISKMIDDLYSTHLREMQSEMHLCASRCCNDRRGTLETVQNCIEGCAGPLLTAQDVLQNELGQFHGQLQHCVMQCNDSINHKIPQSSPDDTEVARYRYQFERCSVKCVDDHLRLIPTMMETLKAVLAKEIEFGFIFFILAYPLMLVESNFYVPTDEIEIKVPGKPDIQQP